MAIQTTPHTEPEKNMDPAKTERDPNQLTAEGIPGSDAELYTDTETAQTAGSRNERVTEYRGSRHNTEAFTAAPYAGRAAAPAENAPGVTNHTVGEESQGQQAVMRERADNNTESDVQGNAVQPVTESAVGSLPGKKEEKAETVEVSSMRPIR